MEGVALTVEPDGTVLLASEELVAILEADDTAVAPGSGLYGTSWVLGPVSDGGATIEALMGTVLKGRVAVIVQEDLLTLVNGSLRMLFSAAG